MENQLLIAASALCFLIGLIHSVLGERYILIRLMRGEKVPKLFGSSFFTKRVLRFAWHLTTIAWWGYGYVLLQITPGDENNYQAILYTTCAVFLISGAIAFACSKGKHLAWIVFWTISALTYYVAKHS